MFCSISLGLARDGLLAAILFKAWFDMLGDSSMRCGDLRAGRRDGSLGVCSGNERVDFSKVVVREDEAGNVRLASCGPWPRWPWREGLPRLTGNVTSRVPSPPSECWC
jgi:hypothetical protein